MKNTVTQEQIDALIANAKVEVQTILGKCTTVTVQLENGFILTESSACVDPANYCEVTGKEICLNRIKNKLWELEGYCLQRAIYSGSKVPVLHDGEAILPLNDDILKKIGSKIAEGMRERTLVEAFMGKK